MNSLSCTSWASITPLISTSCVQWEHCVNAMQTLVVSDLSGWYLTELAIYYHLNFGTQRANIRINQQLDTPEVNPQVKSETYIHTKHNLDCLKDGSSVTPKTKTTHLGSNTRINANENKQIWLCEHFSDQSCFSGSLVWLMYRSPIGAVIVNWTLQVTCTNILPGRGGNMFLPQNSAELWYVHMHR